MSVPIVGISLWLIRQYLIRFANFLELFFGLFITLVFVGVMLHGQFSVSFFDLLRGRGAGDAQNFVVIFFGRHGLRGGRGHRDDTGGAQQSVPQLKAASALMENGAFRFSFGRLLAESLMPVGVERLADRFNRGDAVFG